MLDEGVIPNTDHNANVDKQLSSMTPEHARKAKRKWRKLKRRALRNSVIKDPNAAQEKFDVLMMLGKNVDT